MATVYSGKYSTGTYTYTRVRVDYSGTSATATLLHTRTNSWSGYEYTNGATFTFAGVSTGFSGGVSGYHEDTPIAVVTFPISGAGGSYSGSTSGDVGPFAYSGSVTLGASTYTVSYNANGGSGAPGQQTKTHGVNLTLSSTTPTKADSTAAGFTVTFDPGEGRVLYPTYTATDEIYYTFDHWNTKSDNTGTNYNAGGTYSANASATLYAQWQYTTVRGAIKLPTASRNGYIFLGWTRTPGSGVYVEDNYVAFGDETLYAEWAEVTKLVNAKVNSGWTGNVVKVKINGSWVPVIDIKTSW